MSIIKNKAREIDKIFQETSININKKLTHESEQSLDKYRDICMNIQYYHLKADFFMQVNDINSAINILKECEEKFPLNIIAYIKLYNAYALINDYDNFAKYWLAAYSYTVVAKDLEAQEKIDGELKQHLDEFSKKLSPQEIDNIMKKTKLAKKETLDSRAFPFSNANESLILQIIEDEKDGQWLVNNYRESAGIANLLNHEQQNYLKKFLPTETVKGMKISGSISLTAERENESICLPICTLSRNKDEKFSFDIDDKEISITFRTLMSNKFYYARINNVNHINIKAADDFFIGNPISLHHKPGLKKNVVYIFIDGLSSNHLQNNDISKLMPNTSKFFKNGFIGTNVCSAGDWTLPAHASIATGLSTQNHQLYHPSFNNKINRKAKLMAEYYSEKGYFTTSIQNNWRITPTYGYYKGFDRTIYQSYHGDFNCAKIAADALEALQAFKETNNFLSISFMDLHAVIDKIFETVSLQTKISLSDIVKLNQSPAKSVDMTYNEDMIATYNMILKRIDVYLGIIFDYLLSHYDDEEITVVLTSDHGQSYFNKEDEKLMNEHRILVPFMVRDVKAPCLISDEILQSTDVLPTMLKINDIQLDRKIDGMVPVSFGGTTEREFAYTESIYPGKTYKAALTTKTHIYQFETKDTLFDDGTILLENFTAKYINRHTRQDEAALYPEKMSYFEEQVFNHIKNNIICI